MKYFIAVMLVFTTSQVFAKDSEEKDVPAEFRIAYKNSIRCDEVNDQYVLCNGVRYVRDIKNNDSLKRNIKEIEDFIDSGMKETGPATKGTSR